MKKILFLMMIVLVGVLTQSCSSCYIPTSARDYYTVANSVHSGYFVKNGPGNYSYLVPHRSVKIKVTDGGGVKRIAVSAYTTISAWVENGDLYVNGVRQKFN